MTFPRWSALLSVAGVFHAEGGGGWCGVVWCGVVWGGGVFFVFFLIKQHLELATDLVATTSVYVCTCVRTYVRRHVCMYV